MKLQEYRMRSNEGTNKLSRYGIKKKKPDEYIHCFNVLDEIPKYEPMEVENINDLY